MSPDSFKGNQAEEQRNNNREPENSQTGEKYIKAVIEERVFYKPRGGHLLERVTGRGGSTHFRSHFSKFCPLLVAFLKFFCPLKVAF